MAKLKPIIAWTPALYDRLSKHYDAFAKWLFPIGDTGREKVVSGLTSGRILDVACGTGTLLNKADQAGLLCIGIDTSRGMLLETEKKVPAAEVIQASFYDLPFAEGEFDYVVETNAVSGKPEISRRSSIHGSVKEKRNNYENLYRRSNARFNKRARYPGARISSSYQRGSKNP